VTVKKETTTEIKFSDHESTFSSFYRLFPAKANFLHFFFFFFFFFFAAQFFSFFRDEMGSRRRVKYFFFVPKVELYCPAGEFLLIWARRTKILPRDYKAQPEGQKTKLYPRDTKIGLFPRDEKGKI